MTKSRYFEPYVHDGSKHIPTLTIPHGKAGMYFIKSLRTDEIIYVGHSTTQLKKTIYRHFQTWTDKSRGYSGHERTTYSKTGYAVRFFLCTPTQAHRLERYFIKKLQPRDNRLKYIHMTRDEISAARELAQDAESADTLLKSEYFDTPF